MNATQPPLITIPFTRRPAYSRGVKCDADDPLKQLSREYAELKRDWLTDKDVVPDMDAHDKDMICEMLVQVKEMLQRCGVEIKR